MPINTVTNTGETSLNKASIELQFSQMQRAFLPHLHFGILQPYCNIPVINIKCSFIDWSGSIHKQPFLII